MLKVDHASCSYGKIQVVWDVSITVNEGEMVAILGKNGAGKSTLLKAISGLVPFGQGTAKLNDVDLTKMPEHERVSQGVVLVPEGKRIFQRMTVLENLRMGSYRSRRSFHDNEEAVFSLFPILKEKKNQLGGTLSGGQQQMLAIARAMMSSPKVLMLDEPSSGLAPVMVEKVLDSLKELNKRGVAILLAEQNFFIAAKSAERGYVLENGRVVYAGNVKDILNDETVRKKYLGATLLK